MIEGCWRLLVDGDPGPGEVLTLGDGQLWRGARGEAVGNYRLDGDDLCLEFTDAGDNCEETMSFAWPRGDAGRAVLFGDAAPDRSVLYGSATFIDRGEGFGEDLEFSESVTLTRID